MSSESVSASFSTDCYDTSGAGNMTLNVTTPTFGGLKGVINLATAILSGYSGVTGLTLNVGIGVTNTYSGSIANGAAGMTLAKTGAGTQVFSGANSYSGGTAVNNGTLTFLNNGLKAGANIGFDTTNPMPAKHPSAFQPPVSFSREATRGILADSTGPGGGLTKTGMGTLTLTVANLYTGATNVNGGKLNINGTLGAGANVVNANAGVTNFGVSQTLASLVIADGAVVTLGAPGAAPAPFGGEDLFAQDGGIMVGGATQAVPEPGSVALLLGGLANPARLAPAQGVNSIARGRTG